MSTTDLGDGEDRDDNGDDEHHRQVVALVKSGARWKAASQILLQVSQVGFAFVLARLLTPAQYGVAAMALVLTSYVLVFSDLALGAALVQRPTLTEEDRSTAFWVSVGSGLLITLVCIAISGLVSDFFGNAQVQSLFIVVSLTFFVTSLAATQRALLTREMDFRALELRTMAATIAGGCAAVIVAALGYGPWAIVAQQVVFALVATAFVVAVSPWRPRFTFSVAALRSMFGYSANVLGNRFLYVSNEAVTNGLVGRILGSSALGVFSIAVNVVLTPLSRITVPLADVLFPAFSRLQHDRRRIAELWTQGLPYVALVSLPALVGLVLVASEFVTVLLGERWDGAVPVIQVLAWVGILRSLTGWNSSVVLALDKASALFAISVVTLVAVVLGVLVGAPFGVVGVAVAFAIAATITSAGWTHYVAGLVDLTIADLLRPLRGVVAATVVMAAAVAAVKVGLVSAGVGSFLRLLLLVPVGLLTYVAALRWTSRTLFDRLTSVVLGRIGGKRFAVALSQKGPA